VFPARSTGNILSRPEPVPSALLSEGLAAIGLDLDQEQRTQLLELATLLASWAARLNLTAHRSPAAIVGRLILDALAMERHLPPADRIADLGSGAGFPGLPIAIVRSSARVILVEARERRHHFQRSAIRSLGLIHVDALHGRIEELEPVVSQGIVAQALARPREAIELALPWCASGGWIAIPGSATPPAPGSVSGIASERTLSYIVPCGGPDRTLWLGRRA
jgi:16S rRNA (guanine527-N7)-methyltransferase